MKTIEQLEHERFIEFISEYAVSIAESFQDFKTADDVLKGLLEDAGESAKADIDEVNRVTYEYD